MMKPFASVEVATKMFQPVKNPLSPVDKSVVHLGHDWQVQQTRGQGLNTLDEKDRLASESERMTWGENKNMLVSYCVGSRCPYKGLPAKSSTEEKV